MKPSAQPKSKTTEDKTEPRPCNTCAWRVFDVGSNLSRCHANPPQIRLPFDNIAAWPVVPEKGGGCRLHEEKR